ncbi:unnamed protein product, partial [Owenia fusiformis]
ITLSIVMNKRTRVSIILGYVLCFNAIIIVIEIMTIPSTASKPFPFSYDNRSDNKTGDGLPRILCWIMTSPGDLMRRTRHVQNTWARHCDIDLYMSSKENKSFPTIGLNVTEGRSHISMKAKASWTYIYHNYINKADYFVKVDPDSFLIVENLKMYLSRYNPDEPSFYGHVLNLRGNPFMKYMSGGSGLILSRESVRRLVTIGFKNFTKCMPDGEGEDWKTAHCLRIAGCIPVTSLDEKGRERFLAYHPKRYLFGNFPRTYLKADDNKAEIKGMDCCSEYPVAYHYVSPEDMYLFYYFIYQVKLHRNMARTDAGPVKDYLLGEIDHPSWHKRHSDT